MKQHRAKQRVCAVPLHLNLKVSAYLPHNPPSKKRLDRFRAGKPPLQDPEGRIRNETQFQETLLRTEGTGEAFRCAQDLSRKTKEKIRQCSII